MSEAVSIEGLAQLQASLADLADSLSDLTAPTRDTATAVLEDATPRVPVRGGALRDSGKAAEDGVTWTEPYAGVIFNGWPAHNIVAQPWLDPTDTTQAAADVFHDYIQTAVDQVQGA